MSFRVQVLVLILVGCGAAWIALQRYSPSHSAAPDASVSFDADGAAVGVDRPAATNETLAFNPGWIGAACSHDADCPFKNAFCLLPEEGFPGGYCSKRCSKLCPDRRGDFYSSTFCIEDPAYGEEGICVARCNLHLTTTGCRPGYICSATQRLHQHKVRLVCLPDTGSKAPDNSCTRQLDQLPVRYARPDLLDSAARSGGGGGGKPGEICQIDTPVLLSSPIHGVDYRFQLQRHADHLLVSCRMALAMEQLSALFHRLEIVEVEHYGTYSCRGIAGTSSLSGHGRAQAIDIMGFERATGAPVSIVGDWHGPNKERRSFVRRVTEEIRRAKIFNVVLTPQSNQAHHDHLHLELRP